MLPFPPTIILRHRKENLKKCSLRGLEKRPDFIFFTYPQNILPPLDGYILLTLGAPLLSEKESQCGLCLVDATWRYAALMLKNTPLLGACIPRSLPSHLRTVYPRRQEDCPDPQAGLASLEALYAAYTILGRNTEGLLDNYHWKEQFLHSNPLLRGRETTT
jgi:pre-rRNA-processing protein TSR3